MIIVIIAGLRILATEVCRSFIPVLPTTPTSSVAVEVVEEEDRGAVVVEEDEGDVKPLRRSAAGRHR
jgi:hypothetical protein